MNWLCNDLILDQNSNVSVFETNIRVLGALLSAHIISSKKSLEFGDGYDGKCLLDKAVDLADRLSVAFDTSTKIPIGTVNLKNG